MCVWFKLKTLFPRLIAQDCITVKLNKKVDPVSVLSLSLSLWFLAVWSLAVDSVPDVCGPFPFTRGLLSSLNRLRLNNSRSVVNVARLCRSPFLTLSVCLS